MPGVIGYWSMTDPPGSTGAASAIGGPSFKPSVVVGSGITPTAEADPFNWGDGILYPWMPPVLRTDSGGNLQGGRLVGEVASNGVAGVWAFDCLYRATAPEGTSGEFPMTNEFFVFQPDGISWIWRTDPEFNESELIVFGPTGFLGGTGSISTPDLHDGNVHHIRIGVETDTGTNAAWTLLIDGDIISSGTINIGTDIVLAPFAVMVVWYRDSVTNEILPTVIGHVAVSSGASVNDLMSVFGYLAASRGYQGETPIERIRRICRQSNIPFSGYGTPDEEIVLLGPEPIATTLEVMRDAEQSSGGGVLGEQSGGISYATLATRYNQPKLTIDVNEGELGEPPEPTDDDQQLVNQVIATHVLTGTEELLSDSDSVARSGIHSRAIDVNTADVLRVADVANFVLQRGTAGEYRWPLIEVNLTNKRHLIPDLLDFRLGNRLEIVGLQPDQIPGLEIDLIAEGRQQVIQKIGDGRVRWTVGFNTVPASPYTMGILVGEGEAPGPAEPKRYSPFDSRVESTGFEVGTDTALTVEDQTGGNDLWSEDADHPFDLKVHGCILRCTAVSAPTGAVQTLTVQAIPINEGVEGVILQGGDRVTLATPGRWAL